MFRYLLFDADETLFDFHRSEKYALMQTLTALGQPFSDRVHSEYHDYNDMLWHVLERGEITLPELKVRRFQHLIDTFGMKGVTAEEILTGYVDNLARTGFLLPGAEDVLAAAAEKYVCCIVTNGIARVQRGRFDRSGAARYISHLFISEEIGAVKPDKAFFAAVLDTLGASPEECLVIGDSLTSDMKGALNAGIPKCYVDRGREDTPDFPIEYRVKDITGLYGLDVLDIGGRND